MEEEEREIRVWRWRKDRGEGDKSTQPRNVRMFDLNLGEEIAAASYVEGDRNSRIRSTDSQKDRQADR